LCQYLINDPIKWRRAAAGGKNGGEEEAMTQYAHPLMMKPHEASVIIVTMVASYLPQ